MRRLSLRFTLASLLGSKRGDGSVASTSVENDMEILDAARTDGVSGGGVLGAMVGTVIGGAVTGVAVMAAMAATGGAAASGIGLVGAGMRLGAYIGSTLEDCL